MPAPAPAEPPRKQPRAELLWVLATAAVAMLVAVVDLKLWKMHPRVPIFDPSGDGSYYMATIKGVLEHGWFWHNPDLGAPFGQANFDFPAPFGDLAHYLIVSVLGVVLGGDPVLVFNAFFLLCFALIAVVAYAVMRDLGAARLPALVCSVLFAFLPYHLLRNQSHLFLTSYYAIALVRVARDDDRRGPHAHRQDHQAPDAARRRRLPRRRRGVELLRDLCPLRAGARRAGRRDRARAHDAPRCRARW